MTVKPDYASPGLALAPLGLYRTALICGATPLVIGLGILILFWLTRWDALPGAGLWMLGLGPVVLIVGIVCLHSYLHAARKCGDNKRSLGKKRNVAYLLFAANLPAALLCIVLGSQLVMQVHVPIILRNKSSAVVTNLVLTTPNGTIRIAQIAPNSVVKRETAGENGGKILCVATWKGQQHNFLIRDWIDADDAQGDLVKIDFTNNGIIHDR